MKRLITLIWGMPFVIFLVVGLASAGEMQLPPYKGSQPFESLKSLAGTWEGAKVSGEKEEPVKVEYKVSSNGSTVVETLFPGTPYEMITVYHDKGGKLTMTHYCAIGNQPQMDLVKTDGKVMEFSLSEASHIDVAKEGHMHGLKLTMVDQDHLIQNWTMYKDGKDGGATTIKLARVQ